MDWPDEGKDGALLFVNKRNTVALIDIPTSIARAQGAEPGRVLLSSQPRTEPYPSNEPKTDKARKNLRRLNCNATGLEEHYRDFIRQALNEVREEHRFYYCFARHVIVADRQKTSSKALAVQSTTQLARDEPDFAPDEAEPESESEEKRKFDPLTSLFDDLVSASRSNAPTEDIAAMIAALQTGNSSKFEYFCLQEDGTNDGTMFPTEQFPDIWGPEFVNVTDSALVLTIINNTTQTSSYNFLFPPGATCLLGKVEDSSILRSLVRGNLTVAARSNPTKVFDFICLDPPWPNSSAARKKHYNTVRYMDELLKLLNSMDLDQYIAASGYVGIWITNKPAMRKAVLGEGGLFDSWNVQLVEEWIYTKTTTKGEPVTTLDGLWRKPYEIFLLGRAPANPMEKVEPLHGTTWNGPAAVTRRVIVAVPDLHSRKPCLKPLVARWLGFQDGEYEALEVFARYCVAGWWSWGDECLRFNWEGYWDDTRMEV